MYWGITKTVITDYDITDDKVDALLAQKYSYERDEQTYNTAYKAKLEAERQAKIRKEAAIKEAERQAQIARERAEEQTKKPCLQKFLIGTCLEVISIIIIF